jgi:hypothetical protein
MVNLINCFPNTVFQKGKLQMLKLLGFAVSLFVLVACGTEDDSSGSSSQALDTTTKCDVVTSGDKSCYEYTNLPEANFSIASAACAEVNGTFTPKAACSRTSNVGGCTQGGSVGQGSDIKLVHYYYSPMTVDQVKQLCSGAGEQYVAP